MGKALRTVALIAAVLFAGSLFLFALAVALGMAVLAILALFTAYALNPEQTKGFMVGIRSTLDGWVTAMTVMVRQAGDLMRDIVRGGRTGSDATPQDQGEPQSKGGEAQPPSTVNSVVRAEPAADTKKDGQ